MDLLANELSVHGQFYDLARFRDALRGLMAVRTTARRFGREIQCNRTFLNRMPVADMPMQQAIANLGADSQRRAVMTWLTRRGPFWDDLREHGEDDYLECGGGVVTDTSVGEAAFRTLHGVECGLVSLAPSAWCYAPLDVTWVREGEGLRNRDAEVENCWNPEPLEAALQRRARPLASWDDLREVSHRRFPGLTFAEDCFAPLVGVPFSKSAADRFVALLDILDRLTRAFDDTGHRGAEGHRIIRDFFTGERAWFSDSSESEKRDFRRELTFVDPANPSRPVFCPWHGKVSHLTLRLHFSWPVEAGKPVYVAYAGSKITKR